MNPRDIAGERKKKKQQQNKKTYFEEQAPEFAHDVHTKKSFITH